MIPLRHLFRLLLPTLLLWTMVLGLDAQPLAVLTPNALKRLTVEQLLEVEVVSPSRHPEPLNRAASGVFVITPGAADVSGANSLPELLRFAPGLFVAQSSSYHWGISARGFLRTNAYANKLLVLIDGRTVYAPFYSNVFWDSQQVFLPDLDQIEVITGPSGTNWGSNAVNGVINITTKSARDTLGTAGYATLGLFEQRHVGVRQGVRFGRDGALRVYGQHQTHPASLSSAGIEDELDGWHFNQGGFRADWGTSDAGEFTVQGDVMQGRYDLQGVLPPLRSDNAHLLTRWARSLGPDQHVWVRLYHDYAKRNVHDLLTIRTHTTELEFQHRLALGERQHLLWGASYRHHDDAMVDTVGFNIEPPELTFHVGSVFAVHHLTLGPRWRSTLGLRLEHNTFSHWEALPHLRLEWRPAERQTGWLGAARAARLPDRLNRGFTAAGIRAGDTFTAETLQALELGWRAQPRPNVGTTVVLYYHGYDDLRSVEPGPPAFIANGVEGLSRGVEAFVDWDVTPWWRLRAGGFMMRQKTWLGPDSADAEGGRGEASFPEYQARLSSSFRIRDRAVLWLNLRHVAEVPAYEGNAFGVVPAYTELDASVTWRLHPSLNLSLSGRNLLDRSHPEIGLPATRRELRRSAHVTLRWEF